MIARRWTPAVLTIALALCLLGSATLAGADQAFMRMTGGKPDVSGESRVQGYENWIELDAVAWAVTAQSSWTKGGGASVGKPQPGHLLWTQPFDASVPAMYPYLLAGLDVPTVTVELVKDGAAGPATFAQLVMTGALFTELSFADATAHGAIVFKTLTQSVWPLEPDGTRGTRVSVTWDILAGSSTASGALAPFVAGYGPGNLGPAPVPEPSTGGLLLGGLALLAGAMRRRLASPTRSAANRGHA